MTNTLSGTNPFVNQVEKTTIKKIAQLPEIQFDSWIWRTWRVLPTDDRYLNLTKEQRELLWEDFLLNNPKIAEEIEKEKDYDPEFEQEWKKLMEESESEDIQDTDDDFSEFKDVEKAFEDFVNRHNLHTKSDKKLKHSAKNRKPYADEAEWEEVE